MATPVACDERDCGSSSSGSMAISTLVECGECKCGSCACNKDIYGSETSTKSYMGDKDVVLVQLNLASVVTEGAVVGLCSKAFDHVLHNKYCGILFQCGCTWNWAGGWAKCNVHNPTGAH